MATYKYLTGIIFIIILISCTSEKKSNTPENPTGHVVAETGKENFFPVTNYIKGQLLDIKSGSSNPVKYITINNSTDSAWVKMEDLEKELAEFLTPVIDTINMISYFKEVKFLDQTLNTYTFSYDPDPAATLPDTFPLKRWEVYVDPQSYQVKRIYLIKTTKDNKILQLTWQNNNSARMVYLLNDKSGLRKEKEVFIKWDF